MNLTTSVFIKTREFDEALQGFANIYGSLQRRLFKDLIIAKRPINELKTEYITSYGVTARQFNAIRIDLQGKISAIEEVRKSQFENKSGKLKSLEQKVKKLEKIPKKENSREKKSRLFKIHQYKRRCENLRIKLDKLADVTHPRICFGSNKLFRKQFELKKNGYKSHAEWKSDWNSARNSQFFIVGSKDETKGNQSCQYDGKTLKLRLPNELVKNGVKTVNIPVDVKFLSDELKTATKKSAVTYRFLRRERGWYIHASFDIEEKELATDRWNGAVGVDLNAKHIAVTHVGHDGNLKKSWNIPLDTRKRRQDQNEALIGDAVAEIQEYASLNKIPVVIEKLDFAKKKSEINSRGTNRMLSNFVYSKFSQMIDSRCKKNGVEVIRVNPAYTSIIGSFKFASGYGLSVHQAAAMAIARRGINLGERIRMKSKYAFIVPARNRMKHVWSDWNLLSRVAKKNSKGLSGRLSPSDFLRDNSSSPLAPASGVETPKGA